MGVGGRGDHGPCVSLRDASLGAGPQYLLDTNSKLRKQIRTEQGVDERHSAAHAAHAAYTQAARAVQAGATETSHGLSSPSSPPPPPPPPPPRSGSRSGPATKPLKPARPPVRQFSAWLGRKDDRTKKSKSPARADAQSTPALRSGAQPTPSRPSPSSAPRTVEELLPNEESAAKLVQRVGSLTAEDIARLPPPQRETVLRLRRDLGLG